MVMEASRCLVMVASVIALTRWCSADLPERLLVHEAAKDSLATCHLVLMVSTPRSPLLVSLDSQVKRSFIMVTASVELHSLRRALAGDSTTTCRGLIIHLDASQPNTTTTILRLLERAELWQVPETWLVVLGGRKGVKTVLLHHSLRNTINGLYLALHQRHYHRANTTLPGRRITLRIAWASGWRHRVTIHRRCLYCKQGNAGVQRLGRWSSSRANLDALFLNQEDHFRSLNGHHFNIVSTRYIPYVDYQKDNEQSDATLTLTHSMDEYNLSELSKKLNFSYTIREEPEGSWGRKGANGSFTGMMGQLQRQEVDFCTLCGITYDRNQIVDHLPVYPSDPITVVSLKPSHLSRHFLLVRPLTGGVWGGVVVAVVLWGTAMATFNSVLSQAMPARSLNFNKSLFLGWGTLLEQSVAYLPVNVSKRVLVSVWLTFSLIVVSAYKSSLIANLSIQGKGSTPETLADLIEARDWKWATEDWVFKGYPYVYFSKHQHPVVKKVYQEMKIIPADEVLKEVMKGHFSLVHYEQYITIYIRAHFTDTRGRSPFQISKKAISIMAAYGWGVRRGAPFYGRFHQLISRLKDTGIIGHWTEEVVARRTERSLQEREPFTYDTSREYSKDRPKQVVLGLSHLDGAFYLYFLGIGAAFLAFLVEIFTK